MPESVIADPEAFAPERVELDFDSLGLSVRETGVDWGEAQINPQMVRQAQGETSSDGHRPAVAIKVPLRTREEGEGTLANAAAKLEAKVTRWQEEGGWLERKFEHGGFAGSITYRIIRHTAQLSGLQGWTWAHRNDAPEVVLTAMRSPIGYATVEVESEVFTEAEARELQFELAEVLGTAPGLIRLRIVNKGSEDWRGLIYAAESRDMAPDATKDTTAALAYDAADLTLKGGSTDVGSGVAEHASLTAGWLTILNSEIAGVGHMTHRGVRRLWIRTLAFATDVQYRVRWRPLGALRWTDDTMPIVSAPLSGASQLLDMGECRPQAAALGDERWEWELRARALSGSGKVFIGKIYPLPTEQYAVVIAPAESQSADQQSAKSPSTVENVASETQQAWNNPASAKASDGSVADADLGLTESTKRISQYLKATNFAFGLPEGATIVGIVAEVQRSAAGLDGSNAIKDWAVRIVKDGEIMATDKASSSAWPTSPAYKAYGSSSDLWGEEWSVKDINGAGFGFAIQAIYPTITTAEARVDHMRITVYYTEANDENRVCFAGRSIELRSDGIYRQHPEDDVWGRVIEEGSPPVAIPSGLEGRAMRAIIIPSQGDLASLADSGSNSLDAQAFVQGGFLFAREASS